MDQKAKTYNTRDSPVVTDLSTDLAAISLCSGGRGVKKQGVSGSKNGCLFASVSAVRFKRTVKPAAPQNRSGLCSKYGTAANRALPSGTTPPSGSRGNDELRTPCAIRVLLLGIRLSVTVKVHHLEIQGPGRSRPKGKYIGLSAQQRARVFVARYRASALDLRNTERCAHRPATHTYTRDWRRWTKIPCMSGVGLGAFCFNTLVSPSSPRGFLT